MDVFSSFGGRQHPLFLRPPPLTYDDSPTASDSGGDPLAGRERATATPLAAPAPVRRYCCNVIEFRIVETLGNAFGQLLGHCHREVFVGRPFRSNHGFPHRSAIQSQRCDGGKSIAASLAGIAIRPLGSRLRDRHCAPRTGRILRLAQRPKTGGAQLRLDGPGRLVLQRHLAVGAGGGPYQIGQGVAAPLQELRACGICEQCLSSPLACPFMLTLFALSQ